MIYGDPSKSHRKTIHKYRINMDGSTISMPKHASILKVDVRPAATVPNAEVVYIWAMHLESETETESRTFKVARTGESIPLSWGYIGTFYTGPYVWHLHEIFDDVWIA